jgi:hypothetical protein
MANDRWRTTALDGLPTLFTRQDSTVALKVDYEGRLAALYEEIGRLAAQQGAGQWGRDTLKVREGMKFLVQSGL